MNCNFLKKIRGNRNFWSDFYKTVVFSIIGFFLTELFYHNPLEISFPVILFNCILYLTITCLLWFLTTSRIIATWIMLILTFCLGLSNYYVISFRGVPFNPWDLQALGIAKAVAGEYSYKLYITQIFVIIAYIVTIIAAGLWKSKYKEKVNIKVGLLRLAIVAILMVAQFGLLGIKEFRNGMNIYDELFRAYNCSGYNGALIGLLMDIHDMDVDKPQAYREDADYNPYDELVADDAQVNQHRPNIIGIMSEAFCDPAVVGDFKANKEYIPFIRKMQAGMENTITGNIDASVLGGNTANTEFEFLTGNTLGYLPIGSVAYQEFIVDEIDGMSSYLKSLGYNTIAMHPFENTGWRRNEVYPFMKFDKFISDKDYPREDIVRTYISDQEATDMIIKQFEEQEEPCFLFAVTMQNHGPYNLPYEEVSNDVKVEGEDDLALEQYLSLLRLSDKALENLITYIDGQEEDTILVFFGDHQPADQVVETIWKRQGTDFRNLSEEESRARYKVPFIVWANYDIEEATNVETSANFLGAQLFEWGNIPKSKYQNFLLELNKTYKSISAKGAFKRDGSFFSLEDIKDLDSELMKYYELQYYNLFN